MTISTAGMIEAIREAAIKTETLEEHDVLNSIANRIEILTTANAGMDLELSSIRSALNIPSDQSVQSGVIDAFSRQSSDIAELTEKSNRLRRTAKEHQEENQLLRTELAELRDRPADAEIQCMEDMTLRVINVRDGFSLGRWPVFTRAVPSSHPSARIVPALPVRDDMGFWHHPDRIETPFDEGSTLLEMRNWYAERGMEVDYTYMNQFFCCDCVYDADIETYPARNWHPTPPECGDGWVLLSIFDTEDGPCAEWMRYKDGDA
ncbi:hypothetical protein [Pectobacterium polaris]|uniref:hypothetical protein n=1 Tax=Pectobacterium polaris TaxID=2042057 RepID=UPI0032E3A418